MCIFYGVETKTQFAPRNKQSLEIVRKAIFANIFRNSRKPNHIQLTLQENVFFYCRGDNICRLRSRTGEIFAESGQLKNLTALKVI
jgi:hypothetical protein